MEEESELFLIKILFSTQYRGEFFNLNVLTNNFSYYFSG